MLEGIDGLHVELRRIHRPRRVSITPAPGLPPVEVGLGDEVEMLYAGERRLVRVLAVLDCGIRVRDLAKQAVRAFKYDKIGASGEEAPRTL